MGTDIKRQQALQMYPRDTSTQCLEGEWKKKKKKNRIKLFTDVSKFSSMTISP